MGRQTTIVRQDNGGRITIPDEFRRELGIDGGGWLRITLEDGGLRIEPLRGQTAEKGSPWLGELYDYFAPVRDEIRAAGYSEEEVNADIDAAIRAVRAGDD